jgi:hypothetical protein
MSCGCITANLIAKELQGINNAAYIFFLNFICWHCRRGIRRHKGRCKTCLASWLNCVAEMAHRKSLDMRTAAWRLASDLGSWQELGGYENAIQNAKNQLALLNMTLEDQKAAIATLVNLQKMGMSEIEISRLVKLVNGWGKGNGNIANGLELDTHINLPTNPH